jgi:hypothetical protein
MNADRGRCNIADIQPRQARFGLAGGPDTADIGKARCDKLGANDDETSLLS